MRLPTTGIVLAGAVALLLVACNGGSSSPGDGTNDTSSATYTARSTTKAISAENESSVLAVQDDGATVVLDANSALAGGVAEGDVLMFGITTQTPNGLLRKVTSASPNGDRLELTTARATILDAFEELDLKVVRSLPYDSMASYEPKIAGIEVRRYPLTLEGSAGDTYEINFDGTVLYDADGDESTTYDQVVADGSISFTLGLELEVKTEWLSLSRLKVGALVSEEANVTLSTNLPALEFNKEIDVVDLNFLPFSVGPVVIVPTLELVLGANGELRAQVSVGVSGKMSVSAGAVHEGGSWTPYSDFTSEWDFQPPTLSATARAKVYVGPRVSLMIYGVAGPYAQVDGYLELEANVSQDPWWELYVGIEAFVGVEGEILGYELFNYQSGDLVEYRKLLAQAEGEPSADCPADQNCTGMECGADPVCGESCGTCTDGKTCSAGGQCTAGTVCTGEDCSEWIALPGGTYQMGSNDGDGDEKPVHSVTLSGFKMARTETTVAQYGACVTAGGCTVAETGGMCNRDVTGKENDPINCVDWNQSKAYCEWAGARLCTEAEWEYAARSGGKSQVYPWGSEDATCQYAVMNDSGAGGYGCGTGGTMPVCSKAAGNSEQGICDLAGNVWEWVADWYDDYPSDPQTDPTGPASGSSRVLRGGSWYSVSAVFLRASSRGSVDPDDDNDNLGLRCCRSSN